VTVAPVLDPGRGRVKKGYFWPIARDDWPWGGADPPAVAYTYAPGRGVVHALKLLGRYRGVVQCDGYAAYKSIANAARGAAITLAFCWAHLRRRFIERDIDGQSAEERLRMRKEHSAPGSIGSMAARTALASVERILGRQANRLNAAPLGSVCPLYR
jgi:hypothetical protein